VAQATDPRPVARQPAAGLRRVPTLAVWGITLLVVVLLLGTLPLQQDTPDSPLFVLVVFAVDAVAFASVGALVATRRPANAIGWILWAVGVIAGVNLIGQGTGTLVVSAEAWNLPAIVVIAWFIQWSFNPTFVLGLLFIPLLFPEGRLPSHRWRSTLILFVVAGILLAIPELLRPGQIPGTPLDNPTGIPALTPYLDSISAVGTLAAFVCVPLAFAAAVVRFRQGSTVARQQLKWLAAAAATCGFGLLLLTVLPLPDTWATRAFALVGAAFGLIPVAVGIAILRYRLYDIDRIISRTLSYAIVTAILAGVFAAAVLGLQTLLRPLTAESQVAVAASTLLVAALFRPIRRQVQAVVDRRFDRSRYDAARVADGFGARLRDRLELGVVSAELASTADAALRPTSVSVWVRNLREERRPERGDLLSTADAALLPVAASLWVRGAPLAGQNTVTNAPGGPARNDLRTPGRR
jgi:hypothetical protein